MIVTSEDGIITIRDAKDYVKFVDANGDEIAIMMPSFGGFEITTNNPDPWRSRIGWRISNGKLTKG